MGAILSRTPGNVPFMAIMLLAGLQVIPPEIYEAARIGSEPLGSPFGGMTLPLLMPRCGGADLPVTVSAAGPSSNVIPSS